MNVQHYQDSQSQMLEWLFGRKKQQEQPKKKKPKAQQDAEDKWKYDFILQFLSGPLWKTSLLDFVDYHCVVFDNEEQNKFEYTTLHKKFKELVAQLFDGMMTQVGLDEQKLAQLLDRGFNSKHKKIFNQLLLADDFIKFKQLMVNRNKTLEAEAVQALQQEHNPRASSHQQERFPKKGKMSEEQVLRQSALEEQERLRKVQMREEQELRKVLEVSRIQAEEEEMIKNSQIKAAQKEVKQPEPEPRPQPVKKSSPIVQQSVPASSVQEAPKPAQELPPVKAKKHVPLEPLPPLRQPRKVEESPKREPEEEEKKPEPVVEESKPEPVAEKTEQESQDERKRRLMEQREKIRRKKEEERKMQQFAQEEGKPPVQTILLQDDGIHETQIGSTEDKKVSNAEIDRRRELMKKIKNRIVDDF